MKYIKKTWNKKDRIIAEWLVDVMENGKVFTLEAGGTEVCYELRLLKND